MASSQSPKKTGRRSRKSIAHIPISERVDMGKDAFEGVSSGAELSKGTGRRTRSKSLGPGGLEVLGETAGNRQKETLIIKSILKPSVPLSPIRAIPPRKNTASTPTSQTDPATAQPDNSAATKTSDDIPVSQAEPSDEALSLEEQERKAVRERERKEILERRDARRKSLANRRVSFAPEATLHTWDIIELPEDATSSSEGANSTRRASSGSTLQPGSFTGPQTDCEVSNPVNPPSTPPRAEVQVAASPAQQRTLHQKKRRKSSGIPPMDFNNPQDLSSSPGESLGSDDSHQFDDNETEIIDASDVDSEDDRDTALEETIIEAVIDEDTGHLGSSDQTSSTSSSTRLDNSLRQATQQANLQHLNYENPDEASVDLMETPNSGDLEQLPPHEAQRPSFMRNLSSLQDQENINPFSPAFAANVSNSTQTGGDEDVTMDITQAVGGIVSGSRQSPNRGRRPPIPSSRRRSSINRRRSVEDDSVLEDETMDFVTTHGGIQQTSNLMAHGSNSDDEGQDMSMDLTMAIGGVVPDTPVQYPALNQQIHSDLSADEDSMEITTAVGRVLSPVTERTEPSEDDTMGMDMTNAVGSILPPDLKTEDRAMAKLLMEEEADHGQLTRSPFTRSDSRSPSRQATSVTQSQEPAVPSYLRPTQSTNAKQGTPVKTPGTPSKQLTPQPTRPVTPSKTPPAKNVSMRKTSPKKLFKHNASKSPKASKSSLRFNTDTVSGQSVPEVVLTPVLRRLSGIGIDREGLGSPVVAAKLSKRRSIGESAKDFVPQTKKGFGVHFEDPRALERELDQERAEDQRRESGRVVLQTEADNQENAESSIDVTMNLKDMIQSLTPRKSKLKGRKSLAGTARGILGKRPVELDEDDDEEETPKRLKGRESPLKSIRIPGPSNDDTITRLGKAPKFMLPGVTDNVSTPVTETTPLKALSSPKDQERFRNAPAVEGEAALPISLNEQISGAPSSVEPVEDVRMSMQDFLNVTNIRFMDLSTTKRRHVIAPSSEQSENEARELSNSGLAASVVAGACTVPMLDLFSHSCHELKKYISEGKKVVREIEANVLEENPALFREYIEASPEVRAIIDNQFKNIKTHSRAISKGMWYEWRSKLFDNVKAGLDDVREGMAQDDERLMEQESLFQECMPELIERHATLKAEAESLQLNADEIASCDQAELQQARTSLVAKDEDIEVKRRMIADLQAQLKQKDEEIEQVKERKTECLAEIQEAERVTNDNRGWTSREVRALQDKIDARQQRTGWHIHAMNDAKQGTFVYDKTLWLSVALQGDGRDLTIVPGSAISLKYDPPEGAFHEQHFNPTRVETNPPTSHRFWVQYLQARIATIPSTGSPVELRAVLKLISSTWDIGLKIYDEAVKMRRTFVTAEKIVDDSTMMLESMVLLEAPRETKFQTRVMVRFHITARGEGTDVARDIDVKTHVGYGMKFDLDKMAQIVKDNMAKDDDGKRILIGRWRIALLAFKTALLAGKVEHYSIEPPGTRAPFSLPPVPFEQTKPE